MRRLRSGPPAALAAAPTASTARRARTTPPGVCASTPVQRADEPRSPASARRPRPRRPAVARASQAPTGPAAPSPPPGRRLHRGRQARRSAPLPAPARAARSHPQHRALGTRQAASPRPHRAPRQSRPAGNRRAVYQASTPSPSQNSPIPTAAASAARATANAPTSPHRCPHIRQREPHQVAEPPIPPARPIPTPVRLEQNHRRLGLQLLDVPSSPHPRVATANHDDISAPLPHKLRSKLNRRSLLKPIPVGIVLHRSTSLAGGRGVPLRTLKQRLLPLVLSQALPASCLHSPRAHLRRPRRPATGDRGLRAPAPGAARSPASNASAP